MLLLLLFYHFPFVIIFLQHPVFGFPVLWHTSQTPLAFGCTVEVAHLYSCHSVLDTHVWFFQKIEKENREIFSFFPVFEAYEDVFCRFLLSVYCFLSKRSSKRVYIVFSISSSDVPIGKNCLNFEYIPFFLDLSGFCSVLFISPVVNEPCR